MIKDKIDYVKALPAAVVEHVKEIITEHATAIVEKVVSDRLDQILEKMDAIESKIDAIKVKGKKSE